MFCDISFAGIPTTSRIAAAALLCCIAGGVAEAETRFTVVDSSPTSWVARGLSDYTVSPEIGWTFGASRNFDNGVGFLIQGAPLPGTSIDMWRLNFAAPFNATITPGFYDDFQRFPFQDADRPGLEFASTARLDNMASGFFEVFEATYDIDGTVLSFSADFTHFGETNPANWAVVEIRYNTEEPVQGCNVADIAEPFDVLDLADIQMFISAFQNGDEAADIAEPFGVLDLGDIQAFIAAFTAGCP